MSKGRRSIEDGWLNEEFDLRWTLDGLVIDCCTVSGWVRVFFF